MDDEQDCFDNSGELISIRLEFERQVPEWVEDGTVLELEDRKDQMFVSQSLMNLEQFLRVLRNQQLVEAQAAVDLEREMYDAMNVVHSENQPDEWWNEVFNTDQLPLVEETNGNNTRQRIVNALSALRRALTPKRRLRRRERFAIAFGLFVSISIIASVIALSSSLWSRH